MSFIPKFLKNILQYSYSKIFPEFIRRTSIKKRGIIFQSFGT